MKKRPNATPSGPAGHSRQAFQGGTYSLMLTAAVLMLPLRRYLGYGRKQLQAAAKA